MKTKAYKIKNRREKEFADILVRDGLEFFFQPAVFHVGNISYRTDFYVPSQKVFYEVVGTRQAYSQNRHKIALVRKAYPFLKIKVVNPDGTPYKSKPVKREEIEVPRVQIRYLPRVYNVFGYRGIDLERRRQGMSMNELERRSGLRSHEIHRMTNLFAGRAPVVVLNALNGALNRPVEYIRFLIDHYPNLAEVEKYEREHQTGIPQEITKG